MKKHIYFIVLALTASSLASCSHDYNYDGEYDVKGYFSGSDPRDNLVYFSTNLVEHTSSFVGDLLLSEDSKEFTFNAILTRNLTSTSKVQVTLATDAPLLETAYKDYEVATEEQVEFKDDGVIEIGTESSNFDVPVTVKGLSKILKPTVVPIKIAPVGPELSSPEIIRKDYAYVVITPKDLWTIKYDGAGIVASLGNPSIYAGATTVTVKLTTPAEFGYKGKIGLERDNSLFKSDGKTQLAPEGISTATAVDCEGKTSLELSATFSNPEKFTALGEYVLPMRAIYYDEKGVKHNLVNGEVLIPVKVMDIYLAPSTTEPTGTVIPTTDWKVTLTPAAASGNLSRLIDGNGNTGIYLRAGVNTIIVDMGKEEDIMGLQLATDRYGFYYPNSVAFYGSDDNTNWKELSGDLLIEKTLWNNYSTLKPLSARYIKIEITADNYDMLSEIKIYK
ncbi:F5/8 type C domain-containing protein [Prevotella sp. kh1p2]|nr:F5/8 type C domain-containing protein [Prevotella sp. kh1p2]SNU11045.1 F5/8 type C domain-containing protein [Prevotellaceae bacterium KH2P17]